MRNGIQGLILVFLVLALFLEMRLAFWVALGIPISILGAGVALAWGGQTLNMLSCSRSWWRWGSSSTTRS
jgi:hydrophobic/amphiphilic exporter-1 (mainly G- bacteria), HAE1 family